MQRPPIPRTVGVKFRERIILSGRSRGLSRRRKRSEECGGSETTKTMTTSQKMSRVRCTWANSELNIPYHDEEWGVPVHDEHKWFEFLILEGAQAGLSWDTILRKRTRYCEVLDGFDPEKVARYDKKKVRGAVREPSFCRSAPLSPGQIRPTLHNIACVFLISCPSSNPPGRLRVSETQTICVRRARAHPIPRHDRECSAHYSPRCNALCSSSGSSSWSLWFHSRHILHFFSGAAISHGSCQTK